MCAPTGMPILWALANPKLDEREVLMAMLDREPDAVTGRPGLLFIADKGFASKEFEADLALRGAALLRPEQHGGRTFEGVAVRVAQRVLAPAE